MIAKSHRSECAIVQLVTVRDNGGVPDNLQAPLWFLSSYQHAFGLSNSGYELCAKNENGGRCTMTHIMTATLLTREGQETISIRGKYISFRETTAQVSQILFQAHLLGCGRGTNGYHGSA